MKLLDFFIDIEVRAGRAISQLRGVDRAADRARDSVQGVGSSAVVGGRRLGSLTNSSFGLISAFRSIVATGAGVGLTINSAIGNAKQFETALAGLAKVSNDLSADEIKGLGDEASRIAKELGRTATGVVDIFAGAKQAGFEGDLVQFAEVAARTALAWDVTDQRAAKFLTSFQKGMNLTEPEVYRLGDAVNALSNNFNATAADLGGVVQRIGAVGKQAGLSELNLAALSTAVLNTGTSEERAATGVKNFLNSLTRGESATKRQRQAFEALNIDVENLAQNMQKDAPKAILTVLKSLSKLDKSVQGSVLSNIVGEESKGAIAPLLENIAELERALALVADQTNITNAVFDESQALLKTSDVNSARTSAAWSAVSRQLGQALLPAYNDVLNKSRELAEALAGSQGMKDFLVTIVEFSGKAIEKLTELVTFINGLEGETQKAIVGMVAILTGAAIFNALTSLTGAFVGWGNSSVNQIGRVGGRFRGLKNLLGAGIAIGAITGGTEVIGSALETRENLIGKGVSKEDASDAALKQGVAGVADSVVQNIAIPLGENVLLPFENFVRRELGFEERHLDFDAARQNLAMNDVKEIIQELTDTAKQMNRQQLDGPVSSSLDQTGGFSQRPGTFIDVGGIRINTQSSSTAEEIADEVDYRINQSIREESLREDIDANR